MISLIESALGISVPKWVVEAVLIGLLALSAVLYLEHRGATHELAKLQRSSAALIAKADAQITAETTKHNADVAANQEKLDAALAANSYLQSRLAQRVRDFDAYRRAHPDLPRPSPAPAARTGGDAGAVDFGALAEGLAQRGDELADAVGQLRAALQGCERDRDSLTGLPE